MPPIRSRQRSNSLRHVSMKRRWMCCYLKSDIYVLDAVVMRIAVHHLVHCLMPNYNYHHMPTRRIATQFRSDFISLAFSCSTSVINPLSLFFSLLFPSHLPWGFYFLKMMGGQYFRNNAFRPAASHFQVYFEIGWFFGREWDRGVGPRGSFSLGEQMWKK